MDQSVRPRDTLADGLWPLWKQLRSLFPVWSAPVSWFTTPGAWTSIGIDLVSGLRRNPSTQKAFDLMAPVDAATFDALTALAALNARRQQQLATAVALAYVTVPLTAVATSAEIAPQWVERLIVDHQGLALQVAAGLTLAALTYLVALWRARQIVSVLDLIRIERGLEPYTALELREVG